MTAIVAKAENPAALALIKHRNLAQDMSTAKPTMIKAKIIISLAFGAPRGFLILFAL
jgi:hypothetical protein